MQKKQIVVAAALATLTALGGAFFVVAEGTASAETAPKLGMAEARAIALKAVPGTVKSEELETEKGKQIYSFDIVTAAKAEKEVNVDANTGAVVSVDDEDGD